MHTAFQEAASAFMSGKETVPHLVCSIVQTTKNPPSVDMCGQLLWLIACLLWKLQVDADSVLLGTEHSSVQTADVERRMQQVATRLAQESEPSLEAIRELVSLCVTQLRKNHHTSLVECYRQTIAYFWRRAADGSAFGE